MGLESIVNRLKEVVVGASLVATIGGCASAPPVERYIVETHRPEHSQALPEHKAEMPQEAGKPEEPQAWNTNLSEKENKAYNLVMKVVEQYHLPIDFAATIMAMIWRESAFRPGIVAKGSGAVGYMQLLPKTAGQYGFSREDLFDPVNNIEAGTRYLLENMNRFKRYAKSQDELLGYAFIAYNMGPSALECMLKQSRRISLKDIVKRLSNFRRDTVCVDREKNRKYRLTPVRKFDAVNYQRDVKEARQYYRAQLAPVGEKG
jgi:soluble lytic murein transglycosylase-like protein